MDMISKDGSPAMFTKRIQLKPESNKDDNNKNDKDDKLIVIGNHDKYVAVNRNNYLN